ncbi:hypothetical protein EHM69_00335 [candidate division KSB1 bacterium]|nr:MAG: hypothetical protein EHM69_00335 [candidate division KSB1 bacterium]
MRRFVLACMTLMLCAGYLLAVPTFTPTIDGVKDAGWGTTPDHNTQTLQEPITFNLDSGMYVTDDGQYIYFGFDADNDPWGDGASIHAHVLFDVGNTAAGGTTDPWGAAGVTYGMPYLPDYDIVAQWNTDNQNIGWTGLNTWTGTGWSQTQLADSNRAGGGGQFTEMRIRRSYIGLPEQGTVLNISMWLRPEWGKYGSNCCLPADEDFPSAWANGAGTFNTQFAYTIQTLNADTDPPGIDHVKQIDRTGIEIVFDEPMNISTLNLGANYTFSGWTFIGFRYATSTTVGFSAAPPGFGTTATYSAVLLPGIQDLAGNSIDPDDDSISWSGVGYSDVLFTVTDPSAWYTGLLFKGSFSFYHEYDDGWSGGSHQLYDDGTHGDVTAGDHVFSRLWELVPNGGDPQYQWGVTDMSGNWLLPPGGNVFFSLPDTTDITTSCTLPDVTGVPMDVIFHCDMQFINDPITGVKLAGSFTNWGAGALNMTDAGDGTWIDTVHFDTGSPRTNYFKFIRMDGTNQNWESVSDRSFTIGTTSPQDLGYILFNDYLVGPDSLTVVPVTYGVQLYWTGGVRMSFDVFSHTLPDSIMELGTYLGSTTTHSYFDSTNAAKKFYAVRAVHP